MALPTTFLFVALLAATVFQVQGDSMSPTLRDGDHVLVEKAGAYRPTDIVAVKFKTRGTPMLKRVAAVGGDKLRINDQGLYVNGKLYRRLDTGAPYPVTPKTARKLTVQLERFGNVVPKGAFVLLGDNPASSLDSTEYGLVYENQLFGKLIPVVR